MIAGSDTERCRAPAPTRTQSHPAQVTAACAYLAVRRSRVDMQALFRNLGITPVTLAAA